MVAISSAQNEMKIDLELISKSNRQDREAKRERDQFILCFFSCVLVVCSEFDKRNFVNVSQKIIWVRKEAA